MKSANQRLGCTRRLVPGKGARLFRQFCVFFLAAFAFSCGGDEETPTETEKNRRGLTIRPEATWRAGPVRTDQQGNPLEWLVPNGQRITPFAAQGARLLQIDYALPLGLAVHPEGRHIFVSTSGGGSQALLVVDVLSGEILHSLEADGYFLGLAFRPPNGEQVYVSGGGRDLIEAYEFDSETGDLFAAPDRSLELPVFGFAAGICTSPDGDTLLAVSQFRRSLTLFDLERSRKLAAISTDLNPYAVAIHPNGQEAYVSCEGSGTIQVVDISDPGNPRIKKTVGVGKNPEALLVNQEGSRLYVTNADEDSVSVLEIGSDDPHLLHTIDLRGTPGQEYGSSPNALCFSARNERLYVAQAGLNRIAVLDLTTGDHLGDIPTAWYPTALALQSEEVGGGLVEETLYVANGKGIGMPWLGSMGHAPGAISILPVPQDDALAGLSKKVAENNAFPGRLFAINEDRWENPLPPRRGGETPIKYVFLVVRENKTYDYLLGPYQPAEGEAEGDPDLVMDNYDLLLPNLYQLAERFAICDNYYSNAEASNQGHTILTASTVNTYLDKVVFADGRLLPIELEMVLSPVVWPKKDFIFQNALRNNLPFRDYGEAVGAGRDLLLLNEKYVHRGRFDPPFYYMYSKDVEKMEERIQEWESDRFAGPDRFPRLIFMLLPNDHTFGDDAFMPTYESMVSDNDEATGIFVEWLTESPYWNESVAFITEDDPQQGYDHIDPHRTLMLVVSPWVRRGYVSHVKYSEANLYATIEHILDLPPMTIFDEVAQPMYDLFTLTPDQEPFRHTERKWPEEINVVGTQGARLCADMYFAEPDQADGLLEAHLATVAERKRAGRMMNRLQERGTRIWEDLEDKFFRGRSGLKDAPSEMEPADVLSVMVERADEGDWEGFSRLFDSQHRGLLEVYHQRRRALHATNLSLDPAREVFHQFQEHRPRPVSVRVEEDRADLNVINANGISAQFRFRKEPSGWKFDLSHHLAPAVRILGDTYLIEQAFTAFEAEP
jgi:DNA-binding beta-propeller fold protein YncE